MIRVFQKSDSLEVMEYSKSECSYKLNREELDRKSYSNYFSKYCIPSVCPFCSGNFEIRETNGPHWFSPNVSVCPHCGYWTLGGHYTSAGYVGGWNMYLYWNAKLEEYELNDDSVPIIELKEYLAKHREAVRDISPTKLEVLVSDIYRETGDYSEVIHVGRPMDGGVDVVLIKNESETTLVQVKQRKEGKTESVSTIRNLLGAMYREGSLRGIVVSTADAFSWCARKEATGEVPNFGITYEIDLIDEGKLNEMIVSGQNRSEPWAFGLGMLHID